MDVVLADMFVARLVAVHPLESLILKLVVQANTSVQHPSMADVVQVEWDVLSADVTRQVFPPSLGRRPLRQQTLVRILSLLQLPL